MILCDKSKIGIFLIPKTGTVSLHRLCKECGIFNAGHSHHSYDMLDSNVKDQISGYKLFSFYRDPVDRFLSAVAYYKRKSYADLLHIVYGNKISISSLCRIPYYQLESNIKDAIESITIDDIIKNKNIMVLINHPVFHPQVRWLNHPITITLLNYHDYNNEVKKLMSYFGHYDVEIPKLNESIKIPQYDQVNSDTITKIQEFYRSDYDFFASKGITFSS